ncbi:cold shock domain-containing protein [Frankia sp. EI5c]|uniref:cold shock domain-containing protein n=1 Tax=Frankia sp. EI5c TaxID=683316 RepID=UPI001F5C0433|nr:cold shock domain-containing protein [Frankia sp. EI5c]
MTLRGARLTAATFATALLAAACAGAATDGPADGLGGPPAADGSPAGGGGGGAGAGAPDASGAGTAAVRVQQVGGFVTAEMLATRLPLVVVYEDGRVISEGPQAAVAPGPALPNVQLRRISAADVQKLVDRAVAAGIGGERDFGQPSVTDSPTTRFTVRTADGVRTTEIYALAEGHGDTGLTAHQLAARKAVEGLLDALTDLPGALGPAAVGEPAPYTPAAVAAIVTPWAPSCTAAPGAARPGRCGGVPADPNERAWPGAPLPGETFSHAADLTCVTTDGDRAAELLAAARTAVTTTPWTYDGSRWQIRFRPLLPDESTCADLLPRR